MSRFRKFCRTSGSQEQCQDWLLRVQLALRQFRNRAGWRHRKKSQLQEVLELSNGIRLIELPSSNSNCSISVRLTPNISQMVDIIQDNKVAYSQTV